MRASTLAIVLLLCAPALRALAEIPAEWAGSKVVAVEVVGEQAGRVDARTLGVPLGAPLDRALVRGAIERLAAAGTWSDIQVDGVRSGDGVILLFQLVPRLIVRRVDVVGNRALSDLEIVRILAIGEQSEIERERFPELEKALVTAYAERGYHAAKPTFVLRDTDDPAVKVVRVVVDEGAPTTIESVKFHGEALPRRRGVRRLLGLGLGDPADMRQIEEGLERTEKVLRQSGYYGAELESPRLERRGRRARLSIDSAIGPRFEVRFEGNGPISPSELFAALQLEQERFSQDISLRAIEQKVAELYRRYSFRDVQVSASALSETRVVGSEEQGARYEEHVMVLHVTIDRGEQLEIEAITFPGATHFSTEFLREQVYSFLESDLPGSSVRAPVDSELADELGFGGSRREREREIPVPLLLDPRRMYYLPTYERAIEHIRELYRGDGFLEAQVEPVALSPLPEGARAVANISVVEGPRTFLHDAHIENNRALSSRELLTAAGLARNSPFSYQRVEEARLRMVSAAQEEGYFFVRVEPRVRMSEDGTRAEVVFRVDEGYLVHVAAVEIRGAERSSRAMIADRARFQVGDVYSPSRAREAQSGLLALDVFSSVTVGPDEPTLPARAKTIVITVTERKTQWLGWSAGFSTGEGVRGGLEYGYRNLFGSAVHASFRGQLGYQLVFLDRDVQRRYEEQLTPDQRAEYIATLTLGIPYIPRLPKLAASVDVSAITDIQRDFRMQKESGVVSLIYRPVRPWTLTLSEELEFSDFLLFEQDLDNIGNLTVGDLVPENENTLLSTQLAAAWDHRDRSFNAHRGFLVSATSEYARTLNNRTETVTIGMMDENFKFRSNMLRFTVSLAFYIPLGPKVTIASQTRYGRVVHLEAKSQAYPNRRFYLGGTNFRGWYQNQVVPQDLQDDPNYEEEGVVSRGADTFVASQNELRFPLVGELYGALFTDIGNLWADPKKVDLRQLETVVGLGLRFNTPVASLAFDYGVRAFSRDPFGVTGAFQFAFQTF
jgi:outer membrane protein assembly factor BamA